MTTHALRQLVARLLPAGFLLLGFNAFAEAQPANSVWPMFQHNAKHTGRSPYLGPLYPSGAPAPDQVKMINLGDKIKGQVAIGADGTIYVGVGWRFYALTRDPDTGALATKWYTPLLADISAASPAVDIQGYAYLGDRDNSMTAFDPVTGAVVCRYNHGREGDINTALTIGPDGTIYFAPLQNFYGPGPVTAVPPAPNCGFEFEKWHYEVGQYIGPSSPAVVQDGGQTYVYIGDIAGSLHKFKDNGTSATRLWKTDLGAKISASPVIGADGTVYMGSSLGLNAVDPTTGAVLWTFTTVGLAGTPALAADGTIYVGSKSSKSKRFWAINPDGTEKWLFGPFLTEADAGAYPTVGGDGLIYVNLGTNLYALSAEKVVLWSYPMGGYPINHPVIAGNATPSAAGTAILYVTVGTTGKLYAFTSARSASDSNQAPVANAGGNRSIEMGEVVTFDGGTCSTGGSCDPDGDPITYFWDFGDGFTATGQVASHSFWILGDNQVSLTVSDGLKSNTNTITVAVSDAGGPTSVDDDFTRQNPSCTAAAPCTALGNGWEEGQGDLVIIDGELRNSQVNAKHIAIQPALAGSNLTVAVDLASVLNNWGPRLGAVVRYQDANNYYVFYRISGGTNALRISKVVNGTETILESLAVSNLATNTFFRLQADATGQLLSLSINGVPKISAVDSTFSGGTVGILLGTGASSLYQHRADNFHAQVN